VPGTFFRLTERMHSFTIYRNMRHGCCKGREWVPPGEAGRLGAPTRSARGDRSPTRGRGPVTGGILRGRESRTCKRQPVCRGGQMVGTAYPANLETRRCRPCRRRFAPSFQYSIIPFARRGTSVQNKANSGTGGSVLTAVEKGSYGTQTRMGSHAKQSQFSGAGAQDCGLAIADCGLKDAGREQQAMASVQDEANFGQPVGVPRRIVQNEANLARAREWARAGGPRCPAGVRLCKTKPIPPGTGPTRSRGLEGKGGSGYNGRAGNWWARLALADWRGNIAIEGGNSRRDGMSTGKDAGRAAIGERM
jgi:hypothetical protein